MAFPLSLKVGGLFSITIILAFIFAAIYKLISKLTIVDALYKSISIQTIGGNQLTPQNNTEKLVISIQHFIAYMIFSGLVIITFKDVPLQKSIK
jgi:hypothetical protein